MASGKVSTTLDAPGTGQRNSILISLSLSLALLAALAVFSGLTLDGVIQMIARIPAWAYVLIALTQGTVIFFAALKWCMILSAGGKGLATREATRATTLGALGGQIMPIQLVTPVVRAWIARKHGITSARAIGTSLLEQVIEVITLSAMAFAAFTTQLFGMTFISSVAFALTVAIVFTLLIHPGLAIAQTSCKAISALVTSWISTRLIWLADGFAKARTLSHQLLFYLMGLSVLRYALLAGLNILVLAQLVPEVDRMVLFAAYPLVLLLMSLPFFPGGLGVVELTWSGVLMAAGENPASASEAALALRVVTTFGFLLIAPVLILLPEQQKMTSQ